MTYHTRLALVGVVAGALALVACGQDGDGGATGIGAPRTTTAPAPPTPAGTGRSPRTGRPPGPGSDLIALNDAIGPLAWWDAQGHLYEVLFAGELDGTVTAQHRRDGVLFATAQEAGAGQNLAFYDDGLLVDQGFFTFAGPAGARAVDPSEGRPRRFDPPVDQRQMSIPCQDEIQGYLIMSGALIAAGTAVQRNPLNAKIRAAFRAALFAWGGAWVALYNCMSENG